MPYKEDRKRTGDKSILPPIKAQEAIEATNKANAATDKTTKTELAELKATVALFTERRVMDDIDRFIDEEFVTAEMGGKKLLRCPDSRYICRYHETKVVPNGRYPHVVCVHLETVNGPPVVVCAVFDIGEFNWSKDKTRSIVRSRIIKSVEELQAASKKFIKADAMLEALTIVREEHEREEKEKAQAEVDPSDPMKGC